jgi:hypothetical protein
LLTLLLLAMTSTEAQAVGGWKTRPLLGPTGGVRILSDGSDVEAGLDMGLQAGLVYQQREGSFGGYSRAAVTWTGALSGSGQDLRAGTFLGPRARLFGLEIGADLFQNHYDGTLLQLAPTSGVDVPITVEIGPKIAYGILGVTPTWVEHPDRRVDWSDGQIGVGDEFAWKIGAVARVVVLDLSLLYHHRTVAGGTSEGLAVGIGF